MPVEIRELIVRATIAERRDTPDSRRDPSTPPKPMNTEALVAECVRQVLRILKKQAER